MKHQLSDQTEIWSTTGFLYETDYWYKASWLSIRWSPIKNQSTYNFKWSNGPNRGREIYKVREFFIVYVSAIKIIDFN